MRIRMCGPIRRAVLLGLAMAAMGCAASVKRIGYTLDAGRADGSCDVVVRKHASFDDDAVTVLGTIKIGDSGFSTNCGEDDVLNILRSEACALEADVVNITEEQRPNILSTCYRVTAVLLKLKEPGLQLTSGDAGAGEEGGTGTETTRAGEDAFDRDAMEAVTAVPFVVGLGGGLGSQFATMGFKGFAGTRHFLVEAAFGTEPFVWKGNYAVGGSIVLLHPMSRLRPKLSLLWKSNASSVAVWEEEREDEIPDLLEYDPFPGMAVLGGVLVRPVRSNPGSVEISLGWQTPFDGMGAVERRAREFADRYAWTGSDVATPRWEHFTFSLGIHYPLDWH